MGNSGASKGCLGGWSDPRGLPGWRVHRKVCEAGVELLRESPRVEAFFLVS